MDFAITLHAELYVYITGGVTDDGCTLNTSTVFNIEDDSLTDVVPMVEARS